MPRGKTKAFGSKARQTNIASNSSLSEEDETKRYKYNIKQEPMEENSSFNVPDLSKFKFEKKPHIKIEFEKASPEKQEPNGTWEPLKWKEFLVNLRIMRANNDAPVDTMGCKSSIDERAAPEVYRYQSLISLMLSSQTKDQVTFAAMERLRAKGLTIDNVLKMSDEELGQLIYPVGFWKTKVKYIKKTTQTLKEQYNGDIPDSAEKLCKLTGVGPKMAHICMQVAWNKVTGIGVDTHVHRISNRIGWVKKPTATPEDTRKALESWLPVDLWSEVNHLMVGFGQTICTPISPFCNECLNRDICPSSGKGRKSPSKRTPVKLEVKEEVNSEDEFVEDKTAISKRKPSPKKVQPLQFDIKSEVNNLQVKQKKDKKYPKLKPSQKDMVEKNPNEMEKVNNPSKSPLKDTSEKSDDKSQSIKTKKKTNVKKENKDDISKTVAINSAKISPLKRKSRRTNAAKEDGDETSKKQKPLK